uniref:Uncharacterized protein n=1 Tax=Plectus sambesii TaxID=2011161 RepID=A0A914V2B6_9BILA
MANSPRDIHPTTLKRQHSARTLLNDEPSCKERITEEKMAARLRGFHITPRSEQSENWFFMRPQETFEEIEQRLADWEDDDMGDEAKQSSEGTTVTLSPELNELIAQKNRAFGPAIR